MTLRIFTLLLIVCPIELCYSQNNNMAVIAYYSGGPEQVDSVAAQKLTHIIFSFCHLKGTQLSVDSKRDSSTIQKLVSLKKRNPSLKIILSLGGWGGCAPCSDVFSTATGRLAFTKSVLALNSYFHSDGIDLDWEYPAIEGHPGHTYAAADKKNFTALIHTLREVMGKRYEISFAAGGFQKYLEESVEWKLVMNDVDRVNLMTYDLVNGFSTTTGHHTPLYSTKDQLESTDNAVQYLIKAGIPRNKLVIGGAFYARVWENVPAVNNGLYQSGKFSAFVDYKKMSTQLNEQHGYASYWDEEAKAPYMYNAAQNLFSTFDDKRSTILKAEYVIDQHLNGIMFWEMTLDTSVDGLLSAIDHVKETYIAKMK